MYKCYLVIGCLVISCFVQANPFSIPQDTGWSGFFMAGGGYTNYKSNYYTGPDGEEQVVNISGKPNSQGVFTPSFNVDIRYTFAESRTQLFLGSLIQDVVRFDYTQQLGIRQQIGNKGVISGSFVFSAMPGEVWQDPYETNVERDDTDRKSHGGRLAWSDILGSKVNLTYTYRNIDVDKERSGHSLVGKTIKGNSITENEISKLDRNGTISQSEISYYWTLSNQKTLTPAFIYKIADIDGVAEKYHSVGIKMTYSYTTQHWSIVQNLYVSKSDFDSENPLYSRKADAKDFGISALLFKHKLFGYSALSGFISGVYAKSNSDINFRDAELFSISTGFLYHF
ncbi:DUF2860 family protein [Photobacterium alginatilyticum]|uniref:DUF2860 domain-containing protein n=1 Tax=Photobacterium alginatilyticum TaxID=1775171 RepID=A0ABW9YCQ6_9GAMM|nr:DUF2860 family protein [Photobacterium alginatilyticum]NBI51235.1 DUF2860 domain-containing protein [Photobacterium alginatilyticum]